MPKSLLTLAIIVLLAIGCSKPTKEVTQLYHFPINGIEDIISKSGVEFNKEISSDGNGSLKISADEPTVVRLFEIRNIDVENARLTYQARVRTEDVDGQVYLEMWCHFPGKGEFFSRGLESSPSGTTDWTTQETPFLLRKGENPDLVKLDLVLKGKGTVWIDDIRLFKGPLQ